MLVELSKLSSLFLYVFGFGISTFGVYIGNKQKKLMTKFLVFILSCFPLILMFSIRYGVGTDFFSYNGLFTYLRDISWQEIFNSSLETYEVGFRIGSKLFADIGNNQFVFGMWSIVNFTLFFFSIEKLNVKNKTLAYFVFICTTYFQSMNILRQSIAVCICFLALTFLLENKKITFIVITLFATLFHKSSILFLFVMFIWSKRQVSFGKMLFVIVVSIFFISFWQEILSKIPYFEKYLYLLKEQDYENKDIYLNALYLIIFLFFQSKMNKKNSNTRFYILLTIVSFFINFTGFYTPYLKRLGIYFGIARIPLFCILVDIFNYESRKFVFLGIALFFFALNFLSYFILGQLGVIPYIFIK